LTVVPLSHDPAIVIEESPETNGLLAGRKTTTGEGAIESLIHARDLVDE
jgi:hypothetical protein